MQNPILRGFNPDPSILRVGEDYYIATSTFEYHPAVRLHHSKDLRTWTVVGHALDLDLRGIPDSGGVWAPSLTHADGKFWLAYSIVRTMDGDDKDIDNYVVTAESIDGPWSEPVHLGSRGFDFSFFHDADGTHWITGVQWDQRPEHPSFGGIVLEEYLPDEGRAAGDAALLYQEPTLVEGPNLYRIGDWYYLLLAAGGTGWNHAITVARSRERTGPYERDPEPFVLTSRDAPGIPLQKAGHGELVQTPDGEWMLVHLASRPTLHLGERYSTLGRETCLQRVVFGDDGWLRLADGGHHASVGPGAARESSWVERFDARALDGRRWSTLRAPLASGSLTERPGWLRLRGGHSTASVFDQSMILTRAEEHAIDFSAVVDAEPRSTRESAGIIAWYDRAGWIQVQLTWDAENGRHLRIICRDGSRTVRSAAVPIADGPVGLIARLRGPDLTFAWTDAGGKEHPVPGVHPAWTLSDDHGGRLRFTGLFFGVRAEDLDSRGWSADFGDLSLTQRET
ncbi:glycoside hydrolase family 43 protein [Microbacterium sp. NPDC056234]|uniref:glycoside hydrolase family 43 protein n=1 Tax=Microbacterium sp. NPDC056234 TaxID=3345757 RepID=UPI0035D893CD